MITRYFIELCYKGTLFSGFQIQENATTVQGELESALLTFLRMQVSLTGSSRTDAGVHAQQNYFQFDIEKKWTIADLEKIVYHLNAILHPDIAVKKIAAVRQDAHCRFDAISRTYHYSIYQQKNPFLKDVAYYFPYAVDLELLQQAAGILKKYQDFESFAKVNNQSFTNICNLFQSDWQQTSAGLLTYKVEGNRFLRGMVKALVGTMLKVGRGKLTLSSFENIITGKNPQYADFTPPGHGLKLEAVAFNNDVWL